MMKILQCVTLLLSLTICIEALSCWTCNNEKTHRECFKNGHLKQCRVNEICQNEVRRQNQQLRISKTCKSIRACNDNEAQNAGQCDYKNSMSVCRCCCRSDACNAAASYCLKSFKPINTHPSDAPSVCSPIEVPEFGRKYCEYVTSEGEIGTNCIFTCNPGYTLIGYNETTCSYGNDFASYNNEPPRCIPSDCYPHHYYITNGQVTCTDANRMKSVCSFDCDPGFYLDGANRLTCATNQTWDHPAPTCSRITCESHNDPSNGWVECTDGNVEGSRCDFACEVGYSMIGFSTSTCLDDRDGDAHGMWTQPSPTCQPIRCPAHANPENGDMECTNHDYLGSVCSFSCNEGFFMDGVTQSSCLSGSGNDVIGTWSSSAPTCGALSCYPPHVPPQHGYMMCTADNFDGSDCVFACEVGYVMLGKPISTCNRVDESSVGGWSSPKPICKKMYCPGLGQPNNGEVTCNRGNSIGSKCTFACNSGYKLKPRNSIRTCLDNNNGTAVWSSRLPSCGRQYASKIRGSWGNGE